MKKPLILQLCMLFAILVLCPIALQAQTKVHYINVGQADAILLEFDHAAMMIDAGGEATRSAEEKTHLVAYLNKFFERRPDLNRTIHTIIISHPHKDHTMRLPDVARTLNNEAPGTGL
jgi:competence protein ComEC